ncbi:MAG: tetratricopeptide repeat protein [Betaproteobacteria bacterium]|nr:tetratricopeptide repeat protein [Betaproteobacteria bacterium]
MGRMLRLTLFAAAVFVCCIAFAGEAEWKNYMDAGNAAYRQGDSRAATSSFQAALREAESFGSGDPRLATSLHNLAVLNQSQGRYAEAEPLYKRSLGYREKALGAEHPVVATAIDYLAALYAAQSRHAEAEPLYKRSLAIREKALGAEHPDVAQSLNNLAALYREQGRYAEAEPFLKRSLAIREKALGAVHPDVAQSLNNLALLYGTQGRYAESEPLYRRSLAIWEKVLGAEHPEVATSLNNFAELYRAQGRYAEAEPLHRRSLVTREKSLGAEHPNVATSLNNLALLYQAQGRYAESEPLLRRSLAIREKALGAEHPNVAQSLNNLAEHYREQGRYAEAEPLYRRSLAIREKVLGAEHVDNAFSLNNLALLYHAQGRYAEADPLCRRSLGILENALGPEHPSVASVLSNLAEIYEVQGRYAEAEPLLRRSLAIREKALGAEHPGVALALNNLAALYVAQSRYAEAEPLFRRSLAISEKALGTEHPNVAHSINNLAGLYHAQGRYPEAEPLLRRSLAIREIALGAEHPDVATAVNNLAALYRSQGRYVEGEPLYRRSLAIFERALGTEHPDFARSLNSLAGLYALQGRHAEAEPLARRSLAIREKALGAEHRDVASSLAQLAVLHFSQGRYAEAEPLYRRSLAIGEKTLGPDHADVAHSLYDLASLYRAQKRVGEGLASARRATGILAARYSRRDATASRAALGEQRKESAEFEQHIALLQLDSDKNTGARVTDAAEAFAVAQLARASDTAGEVARMAARFAAGSDALAQLARQRQDLIARAEAVDGLLIREASKPSAQRNQPNEQRLRDEQAVLTRQIADLDGRLGREFPQYAELSGPQPLALDAAQKLLGEDESLVVFLVSRDETFIWAVRSKGAQFLRLAIKRGELEALVKRLRAQLDLGIPEGTSERGALFSRPYDAAAAHELYVALFGPIESLLVGVRHLILVPDGPLQSLPFGVLMTAPVQKPLASLVQLRDDPATRADYAEVAWLIKRYAITVLPAVSSLRALRAFARANPGSEPFVGFGDPVLGRSGQGSRGVQLGALFSRGPVADAREVREAFGRLPETADELRAIAATLKASRENLYLGPAATEARVKNMDLSNFRNVAFATHGLMAGELKGAAEPALVLTPPEQGTALDDGLLTAGEIAQLKLNADWVILSACNTAASDGTPGAEGLSGLAKAFFYAGARSLLVSHWSVSSDASTALTTRMFEETAKGASKAEAMQRSILALMRRQDDPFFAHPAFWAPFVVVGEGNGGWASAAAQPRPVTAAPAPESATRTKTEPTKPGAVEDTVNKTVEGVKSFFKGLINPAPAK